MSGESLQMEKEITSFASNAALEFEAGDMDFAPGLELAFPDQFQEIDCLIEEISGSIPGFVQGVYYLNGPARFGFPGLRYRNWLDGDGMISALCFKKNELRLKSRYVRTRKFEEERKAGLPLFRTFGTNFQGSRLNRLGNGLESPANVSVYRFNRALLAFGEQGLPWQIDPETLQTGEQFTLQGRLTELSPFSAHAKFDTRTGEMFNFGVFFSPQAPKLYFYCFRPEGLHYRKSIVLERPSSIHDFSISNRYMIFYISPYLLDIKTVLERDETVMNSLEWHPEHQSQLAIVERGTGDLAALIPCGRRYCLHQINSFEKDGFLIVDVLEFDEPLYRHYQPVPTLFHTIGRGGPVRFMIDCRSWELVDRIALDSTQSPDFPALDPSCVMRPYSEFWMLGMSAATAGPGRKFFDALVHVDWNKESPSDIYHCPPLCYLAAEPVVVGSPESSGREGVVICQEFDARKRKTSFLLFDKNKVSGGPIARLATPHQLHLGFHAVFIASDAAA
jgi:all-trans-8'-apo-beta-carotenal 15,15'-oxygenase